jgi:hypothetical protein
LIFYLNHGWFASHFHLDGVPVPAWRGSGKEIQEILFEIEEMDQEIKP